VNKQTIYVALKSTTESKCISAPCPYEAIVPVIIRATHPGKYRAVDFNH